MGHKSIMSFFHKQEKEKQKDLENRANQFLEEYKIISRRYQCDFHAYLKFKDGGEGGISAALRIVDITDRIKAEEEAERKVAEATEKQRLEAENKVKENGNQKP